MFIETLEFTIPVDLCDLFSSLKRGPKSNMEFPASVNSYGTTQDANIQVLLRANKLTFKVDGVSSNSSMISKSECKTLKLSVFDVDTAIGAEEDYNNSYSDTVTQNMQYSNPVKRTRDYSVPVSSPPAKSSRNSFSDTPTRNIPQYSSSPRNSNQNQSKSNDNPVNIKQEPEDPDLIEIEPDPEPDDIVPKKETPYMQIDYSSDVPHTQTSQAALERLSHPHSSHSQSPASSSSSFHQNVPHVQDYSEPGPSQGYHGDQSADDFLVFQDDDDGGEDNEADYSNDGMEVYGRVYTGFNISQTNPEAAGERPLFFSSSSANCPIASNPNYSSNYSQRGSSKGTNGMFPCPECDKVFTGHGARWHHIAAKHNKVRYTCVCGKVYLYKQGINRHKKTCTIAQTEASQN